MIASPATAQRGLHTDIRSVYFPYCMERQGDGSWLLLNRNYKPVGLNTAAFVRCDEHPVSVRIGGLTPETLQKLSVDGKVAGGRVYLYLDNGLPTSVPFAARDYLERLTILMQQTIEN